MGDIQSIDIRSGVNEEGEGFCTLVVISDDGKILLGQLDPTSVREMALGWFAAAEAAEQDAAVLRAVRKITDGDPVGDELAGRIIVELRESRD